MGLTYQSTQNSAMTDLYHVERKEGQYVIALAGNPNTGKSTVFNELTGLHQHTGNWPGKTVVNARGEFTYGGKENILVDLPGTYSLFASSVEEEVARDFICFGGSDAVIVVTDATCLERNLNLAFQVMELTTKVVLCINLIDEAKKKRIYIDGKGIEKELGIPVVMCAARSGIGMTELKEAVIKVARGEVTPSPKLVEYSPKVEKYIHELHSKLSDICDGVPARWLALRMLDGDEKLYQTMASHIGGERLEETVQAAGINVGEVQFEKEMLRDEISEAIYRKIEELKGKYMNEESASNERDRKIDNIVTSRRFGIPIMFLCLAVVFWITIAGANVPSALLAAFLFGLEDKFIQLFHFLHVADWMTGVVILGLYRTLAWVVSVMLPPMAIFFPLFTILEDLGFLPRVAFNMDHLFKRACAHGKQCLTMIMGFGCNAAGIVSCRIIESPRERMIAILTNNFVPCNGRFPTLIAIASVFLITGSSGGIVPALAVSFMIVIGIGVTLLVSFLLSKTILKGIPSTFTLELPPYRVPKIGRVLYTSMIDRSIFVLKRAVVVAAPAGAVIWILANVSIGDASLLTHMAEFFDPFAKVIGLDGFILLAFILGLPANEIVLPILLMAYLANGSMMEYDSLKALRTVLTDNGWTYLTALNTMLFSLLHWPCATTLMTIRKETGSVKWTIVSAVLPTAIAILVCFTTTCIAKLIYLIF